MVEKSNQHLLDEAQLAQQQFMHQDSSSSDAFDDDGRKARKTRTSDPNFNQEKTNLIVNYLPQNFTDQEFFNLFSTVGKCNKARIIRHRQTGYSYGYGFIDMGSSEDAEKAIRKLNQYQIGHKRLKVAYSLPSGERTRNINLYIKGLPKNWTKRDLEKKFREFGEIRNARILLDPSTQVGTGVGFLLYATRAEAERACQLNGELLEESGENLQISFARSQSQPPLEWVLQSSILQQSALATFPGVAPQTNSAYKGRRYNPIVRPTAVSAPTTAGLISPALANSIQQPQQRQLVYPHNQIQQMFMVPAYNSIQYQQIGNSSVDTVQILQQPATQATQSPPTLTPTRLSSQSQLQQTAQSNGHMGIPANTSQISAAQIMTMPNFTLNPTLLAQPYNQQQFTRGFFSTGVM